VRLADGRAVLLDEQHLVVDDGDDDDRVRQLRPVVALLAPVGLC
jgi:hypothetical protein